MKGIEVLKALKIKQAKEQYPVIVEDMKQKPFEDAFESYFGKVLTRYNPNSTNGLTKCIEDYINFPTFIKYMDRLSALRKSR